MILASILEWWQGLEWTRLIPEMVGKFLGVALGFIASWYLLFRRRLNALTKFQKGESDDIIFQMHTLHPVQGSDDIVLLFRNVVPNTTLNELYDNPAAREIVKKLADDTALSNPILQTKGTTGFEVLNDAFGHVAGHLACSPFQRDVWLFTMTCEDRMLVRKRCIRCFLIKPADLERFSDWKWCWNSVLVEKPWHWFRIVALHQIATEWKREQAVAAAAGEDSSVRMPLVNDQDRHDRIREMAVGVSHLEIPIGRPYRIPWKDHRKQLRDVGLTLEEPAKAPPQAE